MLGPIIGDLAAWTWEHDKDVFYRRLVAEDAHLSGCGLSILAAWETGRDKGNFDEMVQPLKEYLLMYSDPCDVDRKWIDCVLSGFQQWDFSCLAPLLIAGVDIKAWNERKNGGEGFASNVPDLGNDGFYVKHLGKIINRLRYGATKREAMSDEKDTCFIPSLVDWYNQHKHFSPAWTDELLMYVSYALKCFAESWDFTSAIHNAMRCPHAADLHLLGMITGSIAEAMYGCRGILHKEKYCQNSCCYLCIRLPKEIESYFGGTLNAIRQYEEENRVFFPKNNSRTNVERHFWTPLKVLGLPERIGYETRRRLLKAYEPGWEARYGVYLDDGWFYICRSFVLLARFQLKEIEQGWWTIANLQKCADDDHDAEWGIREVFDCIGYRWYLVGGEREPENLRYCRYYRGEFDNPFEPRTPKAKFWHGEMMFITQQLQMSDWQRAAERALLSMDERHKTSFLSYSKEQQAILIYISNLFAKWRPYDDQEWMKEY